MSGSNWELSEGRLGVEQAPDGAASAESGRVAGGSTVRGRTVPAAKVISHFTRAERAARGKAARAEVPRSTHGGDRVPEPRDPVALLEEQAVSRVPELVPIRYGRMLVSPFAFYRGGALIMAADLARTPISGLRVQLCGDAHLSNFGVFGSPERKLVFDINDFDETAPGPWEWDVKRLAASFAIAGRENGLLRRRSGARSCSTRCAPTGRRCARSRGCATSRSGTRTCRSSRRSRSSPRGVDPEAAEEGRGGHREGAHEGQHARVREADHARRRRAVGSSATRR